jgi:hypothetical protein
MSLYDCSGRMANPAPSATESHRGEDGGFKDNESNEPDIGYLALQYRNQTEAMDDMDADTRECTLQVDSNCFDIVRVGKTSTKLLSLHLDDGLVPSLRVLGTVFGTLQARVTP